MLKSDVFFAEILVAYTRLLVTWLICLSITLLKYLLKSYLHSITAPAHLYMSDLYMAFFAFWAAVLIGAKSCRMERFSVCTFICSCLSVPPQGHLARPEAMPARPGWLGFRPGWLGEWTDATVQTENLPILQDFLVACTRLCMSVGLSVVPSVRPSNITSFLIFFGVLS